jgi:hypothetical protein
VVKSVFLRSASQLDNFTSSGKQHYASHSNEQAVLYHAGHVAQLSGYTVHVGDLSEIAIEDVIIFVGYEGLAVRAQSHVDLRT